MAALQQQLHISTNTNTLDQHTGNAWSSLVVPYHPINTSNTPPHTEKPIISISETNTTTIQNQEKPPAKKRNPYSIEELLKKPEKKEKRFNEMVLRTNMQQPFGVLVENGNEDEHSIHRNLGTILNQNEQCFEDTIDVKVNL